MSDFYLTSYQWAFLLSWYIFQTMILSEGSVIFLLINIIYSTIFLLEGYSSSFKIFIHLKQLLKMYF